MSAENLGLLVLARPAQLILKRGDGPINRSDGRAEVGDLGLGRRGRHVYGGNRAEHQGWADGDAGRGGAAVDDLGCVHDHILWGRSIRHVAS